MTCRLTVLLAALVATAPLLLSSVATASASQESTTSGSDRVSVRTGATDTSSRAGAVRLKNVEVGKCLDGNANKLVWECNGSHVQRWEIGYTDDGSNQLVYPTGGTCLRSDGELQLTSLTDCANATHWEVITSGDHVQFKDINSDGDCLAILKSHTYPNRVDFLSVIGCGSSRTFWQMTDA